MSAAVEDAGGAGGVAAEGIEAPITHRRVAAIAIPIMLSNVTVPLLGMVDTFVVGQLGEAAPIAAVGLASAVISLIYWMFGFLRMGTSGLVAQAKGAGEAAETGALLMRGLVVGVGAGLVFVVLQGLIVWLAVVASPAEPEVEAMAAAYLSVRLWGAPFAISIYALTGWLIGMERTRGVLTLQLCMNGLNAALSLLFVLGFGWGVEGVAAATVIAEVVGAALGLLLCREAFAGDQWRDLERVLDRAKIRRMAEVNRDILIRSALLETGFLYFIFVASPFFGTAVLAANHVLFKFIEVTAFALDGFAFAAETLAGQAFGARRPATVRRAAVMSSLWGLGMTGAISALFLLAGPMIIDLIAVAPDVREEARRYLPWIAAIPVLSLPAFMFDGVFVGATRTRDMRDSMVQSTLIYFVCAAVFLPMFGVHGLWAAMLIFFSARGATLCLRYPALERAAGEG